MTAPRLALGAVVLAATGLLAGCGGGAAQSGDAAVQEQESAVQEAAGEDSAEEGDATGSGTPQTVDCPGDARPVAVPAGLRAPLPSGTVVVAVARRSGGRTVVTGVVPAEERDVLAQLQQAYPGAGLTLTDGETEEHDAESNFTGEGLRGRWGIRELSDCSPAATRIDLVVAPLTS